jgi:phosphoglycolate phosphatase-like HAD superfamily hydrolase
MNRTEPHQKLEALLFDLDGTLVATSNRWTGILAARLLRLKRIFPHLNPWRTARRLINGLEFITTYGMLWLEHLGVGSGFFGLADRIRRSKGLATRAASTLIPGSEAMLKQLSRSYLMAIVTTRQRAEAEAFLNAAHIDGFFHAVVTRSDVWHIKPHPSPVRKAAQLLGLQESSCLMVGDTALDIRSAKRAGARAVGVLTGYDEGNELIRAGAEQVLPSAADLIIYLQHTT